jgi:hypothetical protein
MQNGYNKGRIRKLETVSDVIKKSIKKKGPGYGHNSLIISDFGDHPWVDGFTVSPMYVGFQRCHFFTVSELCIFEGENPIA